MNPLIRTTLAVAEDGAQRAGSGGDATAGSNAGTAPPLGEGGVSPGIGANITAGSLFFFSMAEPGGTPGQPYPYLPLIGQPGRFQIKSTNPNDTSIYYYLILEP